MKVEQVRLVVLLMLASLMSCAWANAMVSDRIRLNMNTHWLYSPSDMENGQVIDLDEHNNFMPVSVPHANTVLTEHLDIDVNDYRFVSWYRRHFSLNPEYSGSRIFVEFQGVATVADVYVNGAHVTQHKGAYTGFTVDISEHVKFGKADNVIAVRVDSTRRPDIPPEGDKVDYALFGGIIRDVNMVITNPVYATDTFITTPEISETSALVSTQATVANKTGKVKKITVETEVRNASGKPVASGKGELIIAAGAAEAISYNTSPVATPHLWDIDAPYLYSTTVTVRENGKVVDTRTIPTGFRTFEFTKEGFYLNGRSVELFGLNRHEQWPWIGRAVPNRLQVHDADILKHELGLNIVRLSHYPQDPEFIQRADEIGLLLLEELPGWQHIGDKNWQELAKQNLKEMILRDRNHPSIISWGVRINESNDSSEFYADTNAIARSLDPTRPTHGVRTNENHDGEYQENGFFGYNDYNCWDGSTDVKKPRDMPWLITEMNCEWKTVLPNSTDTNWVSHMKEFARIHEAAVKNPNILGSIGWSYVDYNTEVDYNDTHNNFYSGAYDLFRLPRFSASFYKSQRDPAIYGPMVAIASFWTASSPTKVTIASNTEEVELFLNDVSVGIRKPNVYTRLNHPLFEFPVKFAPGELRAEGRINGKVVAVDKVSTPGEATGLTLIPDSSELFADGSDLTSVKVRAVDSSGNWVPYATPKVTFSVSGAGRIVSENPLVLENGRASLIIQSKPGETGEISLSAGADNLQNGSGKIRVIAANIAMVPVPDTEQGTSTPEIKSRKRSEQ